MFDIWTVVWKEWKEFLHQRGSTRGTILMMLIPTLILGVLFPLQTGRMWVESPISLVSWAWVPLLMVATMIADSFAGERERHTLETLLVSCLSDSTILYGKICAAMFYALSMTFVIVTLGLVIVNIFHGEGELLLYPFKVCVLGTVLSILIACFAASVGILVSLRAATVRQAQQTLSFGIIIIAFLPGIVFQMLPHAAKKSVGAVLITAGTSRVIILTFVLFLILDIVLLTAARARFKRTRLILD